MVISCIMHGLNKKEENTLDDISNCCTVKITLHVVNLRNSKQSRQINNALKLTFI